MTQLRATLQSQQDKAALQLDECEQQHRTQIAGLEGDARNMHEKIKTVTGQLKEYDISSSEVHALQVENTYLKKHQQESSGFASWLENFLMGVGSSKNSRLPTNLKDSILKLKDENCQLKTSIQKVNEKEKESDTRIKKLHESYKIQVSDLNSLLAQQEQKLNNNHVVQTIQKVDEKLKEIVKMLQTAGRKMLELAGEAHQVVLAMLSALPLEVQRERLFVAHYPTAYQEAPQKDQELHKEVWTCLRILLYS